MADHFKKPYLESSVFIAWIKGESTLQKDAADERWYWVAPMLLEFAEFPDAAKDQWNRPDLAQVWAGVEVGEEGAGWSNHVEQAAKVLEDIRAGADRLGVLPD